MMNARCLRAGWPKRSFEVVDHFGAASYETQKVEGHWRHGGVVDRWAARLEQIELWIVSYRIEVE
jgi:hypothetical protein